jgi:regulatory protein
VRITKIENQKKRPGRKNIYADGKFVAGISAETLLKLALRPGDDIGPEQLKAIQAAETVQSARNTALRFLSARPRTEQEMRSKLREKEFSDEEISRVLQDFRKAGLLDDREFTRLFIRNARTLRPAGAPVLRRKLSLLGVDRIIVDAIIAEELTAADQTQSAHDLAARFVARAKATRKTEPPEKLQARLTGFLRRRGFRWETIRDVMNNVLGIDE